MEKDEKVCIACNVMNVMCRECLYDHYKEKYGVDMRNRGD